MTVMGYAFEEAWVSLKRSGRRNPFDREKLVRSIAVAIRKRPVDPERVERMVSTISALEPTFGSTGNQNAPR